MKRLRAGGGSRDGGASWRVGRAVVLPAVLGLLQACVYVPRTTAFYDADCQVSARRMDLAPLQLASIQHCGNEGCVVLLVAAGATAAASAIVSGSIVIVGNVAYWFEKQGRCRRETP
ncbi:MAG: hypothetical protein ACT6SF_00755 [Hydrogenophaga sp.]|jgi:hypothetical protein|uniref:hypothetical protein n=1 Tax=Hydrogenophaga sp. TaxID=1904254 RepID=UPI001D3481A9|nr:hypothetical protein [Hydrogenophaga sp.]MBW0171928.1 hypothetical protein [Hydrogenophaga sp.]MBW0184757.1 hypothetical protein [Hydrogenophaga sp.]